MEVKFNVSTLDKDTNILYPASDEFVSVSDAFAERLKATKRTDDYEFNGSTKKPKEDGGKVKDLEAKVKDLEAKLVEASQGGDNPELSELQAKLDEANASLTAKDEELVASISANDELKATLEAKDAELASLYEDNEKLGNELTELKKA